MIADKKLIIVRRKCHTHNSVRNLKSLGMGIFLVLVAVAVFSYTRVGMYTRTYTRDAHAATSSTLNFQTRLLTSSGGLVADGSYSIAFNLYNVSGGGTTQWTETQAVTTKNGYASVYLGNVTPFPGTIDWSQEQWLTMNVNGDGEMTPRIKLTAVPFAFAAESLIKTNGASKAVLSWLTPTSNRTINLPDASGTVALSSGGTFTNNGVIYGNGTSVLQSTAAGLTGQCFVATTGAAPSWGSCSSGITLQDVYDNSTGGITTVTAADGAFRVRDNSTTFGNSNIFSVQNNAGTVDYIAVQGDGDFAVDTNTLFVDATTNNVGVGNVDPDAQLTIASSNTTSNQINLRSQRAAIINDSVLGGIQFSSNDTTNAAPGIATVDVRGIATATHTATVLDSALVVRTTNGTVLSEVARFTANSRLGIGTIAPTGTLGVTTATPTSVAVATGTAQIPVAVFTGGIGGTTTIATTGTGGAGGAFNVTGGAGGVVSTALTLSTGGAGGALNLNGGAGGAAAVAGTGNNTGGAGGAFVWQAGTGGLANGATSGNNTGGGGGGITLQAGTGGAANTGTGNLIGGAGGTLVLRGGTGGLGTTSGGNGGAVSLQGGTAAAMAGSTGGAVTVSGTAGSATGSGGNGGALTLAAGSAGGDNTVSRTGGAISITAGSSKGASAGGAISVTAGTGGNNLTVGTATGGASGGITINGGNGGIAPNADVQSTGGAATGITFTAGTGGAASVAGTGNNIGGVGGTSTFTGGNGGAANGVTSGNNTGGNGGGFTLQGGTGGAATLGSGNLVGGTGGALQLIGGTGGVGTTGGNGGTVTIQGGAAAAIAGAAGGATSISGTQGSNTGSGGAGGALTLSAGAARGDNTVARAGGNLTLAAGNSIGGAVGGVISFTGGNGGNNLTVGTATGGASGGVTISGGNGGTAPNATVQSTGGAAGGFTINAGTGGAASVAGTGNNIGGAGGAFAWTAGTGGTANGATSGANTGGAGGAITLRSGTGGNATTGTGSLQGGVGGGLTLQAGSGGTGTTLAGAGGALTLNGGLAGAASAVGGDIVVQTAQNTAFTERMRVTNTGYVGIGTGTTTSLPNARLTVAAENTTTSQVKLRSTRSAIVASDILGGIDFDTNDTNLTAPGATSARIQAVATAIHTAAVNDTALVFSTSSGVTLAERWRINSTGELQGNGASTIRANAGNLTISTVTSGNIIINGAGTLEVQDSINITGTQLTNSASTVNAVSALTNFAADGPIGTAAATVDIRTGFTINQTTAGRTLTIPAPTVTTAGRIVYISNIGSTSFIMHGVTVSAGANQSYIYNGTAWAPSNVAAAGAGVNTVGAIDSQTKSADGAVISGNTIYLQTADATSPGLISAGVQTIAGAKTLTGVTTLSSVGTALSVNNDVSVGGQLSTGTLNVSGLSTLASLSLSGSISGGTSYSGSGNINTTAGAVQTNSITRIDNTGNLSNIGTISLSGAISGGTTYSGSGNINSTGGSLQTNSITRLDNTGNLTNIGNITGTSALALSSGGIGILGLKTSDQSAASTNSADVSITSGNAGGATSNSGNVVIDAGTATGTTGLVNLGTTNASGVNIGKTGANTTINGLAVISGNLIASGSATGTTATATASPGTNTTTINLIGAAFANDDVIFINNAGQDYYARIVSGGGTATLTVSPAVNYDASAAIEKYNVQNVGATSTDYSTQANRFFQGFFLGGVVTGAGSTTLSDGNLNSTGSLTLQRGGGAVSVGGNIDVTGTISGNGSGITNVSGSAITGTISGLTSLTLSGAISGGTTFTGSGDINTTGGVIQTNSTTRIDNSGNLLNIGALTLSGAISGGTTITGTTLNGTIGINTGAGAGTQRIDATGNLLNIAGLTLSGAISGGTTFTGSGDINTTGGVIQTNSTTRIDNSGNLSNIGTLTLSGAISGGTSFTGSGNVNTTAGVIQTNSTTRIDNSGNLTNIGNISGTGALTLTSGGVGDLTLDSASNTLLLAANDTTLQRIAAGTYTIDLKDTATTALTLTNSGAGIADLNIGEGALQTNGTSRLTNTGALQNITSLTLSGAISGGTTFTGSGDINTTGGVIQTNSTTRIDNSGNLTNIGNISGTGALTLTSGGVGTLTLNTDAQSSAATSSAGITLKSGDASGTGASNSGDVTIDSGASTNGTTGLIQIGTANASGLTLSRSGIITTVGGTLVINGSNASIGTSGLAGTLTLSDGSSNTGIFQTTALGSNRTYTLPDENGTVCVQDSLNCGFIKFAEASAQVDSGTDTSLFINKTGASGNILTLQKNGSGVFTVANGGATQISTDSTTAMQIRNAAGTSNFFTVDTSGAIVQIGSSTGDATGVLFVLDSKTGADPVTGVVNGAQYYNSTNNRFRCYENGAWRDCVSLREDLVAHWNASSTKTNIGTAFVDIFTQANSDGKSVQIDTNDKTQLRLVVNWNKIGGGTQTVQILEVGTANVLATINVVSGRNDTGVINIPAFAANSVKYYKLQAKSTTANDDPVFESASITLK